MADTHTQTSRAASERDPNEKFEKAAEFGRRATKGAKEAASEAASAMKDEARRIMDRQIDTGAAYLGHTASSMRMAANDLSRNAPPIAGLAELLADRLDDVAGSLEGKTAEEVWSSAVDFTRRQPGIVFGLASLAGFLAYRTIKNTKNTQSPRAIRTRKRAAREFDRA